MGLEILTCTGMKSETLHYSYLTGLLKSRQLSIYRNDAIISWDKSKKKLKLKSSKKLNERKKKKQRENVRKRPEKKKDKKRKKERKPKKKQLRKKLLPQLQQRSQKVSLKLQYQLQLFQKRGKQLKNLPKRKHLLRRRRLNDKFIKSI